LIIIINQPLLEKAAKRRKKMGGGRGWKRQLRAAGRKELQV
jgi:hypothetical protein